jgi:MFS family permease
MFAPTTALGSLWAVSWMCSYYHLEQTATAHIVSFLFFGWVVGSPLSGVLTNYFGRCKVTMQWGTFLTFFTMCLLIAFDSWSTLSLKVLWFCFGFFSSGFLPFMTIIKTQHPPHSVGMAMGFGNGMNMVGGAILQPLIGWFLDQNWDGATLEGVRLYSPNAYAYSLLIIPALLALSYGVLFFVKERDQNKLQERLVLEEVPIYAHQ